MPPAEPPSRQIPPGSGCPSVWRSCPASAAGLACGGCAPRPRCGRCRAFPRPLARPPAARQRGNAAHRGQAPRRGPDHPQRLRPRRLDALHAAPAPRFVHRRRQSPHAGPHRAGPGQGPPPYPQPAEGGQRRPLQRRGGHHRPDQRPLPQHDGPSRHAGDRAELRIRPGERRCPVEALYRPGDRLRRPRRQRGHRLPGRP